MPTALYIDAFKTLPTIPLVPHSPRHDEPSGPAIANLSLICDLPRHPSDGTWLLVHHRRHPPSSMRQGVLTTCTVTSGSVCTAAEQAEHRLQWKFKKLLVNVGTGVSYCLGLCLQCNPGNLPPQMFTARGDV
mmetsp:Transcript_2760/g.4953  ORF Transcript_2760/g.4953 Transcript_2760/m.4953 type:complete len:132 (-) Transcript_2760:52-447(-)